MSDWWEEEREPTLQEAWEMLSDYLEHDLDSLGGQDGTAELWLAFQRVKKAIQPLLEE